ncbi:MAG: Calx-beta domain-containing protein [Anaerolineae bacterium]
MVSLSINDVTLNEGDSGTTSFIFTVSLNNPSGQTVTVDYATADGTAAQPADYTITSGTLTFTPGVTSQQITVAVNGDTTVEGDETFFVNLSNPVNATLSDNQGLGTITNDDAAPPSLSINDVTLNEGDSGTTSFLFTVSLSAASTQTVTVDYATADGTAAQPGDYTSTSGVLTFTPGTTAQQVTVLVNGDTTVEGDETFFVNLSNATNATLSDNQGLGTLTNDDAVTLSINDVTVTEGNSGTTNAVFTVTLTGSTTFTTTVDYTTNNGTAVQPADYTLTSGVLTFTPGVTTQTITVPVIGELIDEGNETYTVDLSNAVNANISDSQGLGTITDDDTAGVTISPSTPPNLITTEAGGTANFTVVLNTQPTADVTITLTGSDSRKIWCRPRRWCSPPPTGIHRKVRRSAAWTMRSWTETKILR